MTKAKGAPKKTVLFGVGVALILLLMTLVVYQVDSTEIGRASCRERV